jgi:hypothetical protein
LDKIVFNPALQDIDLENAELTINLQKNLQESIFEKDVAVYKIVSRRKNNDYDANLLKIFGFTNYEVKEDVEPSGRSVFIYLQGNKRLRVVENGNFVFELLEKSENTPLKLSDNEVMEKAKWFLQENGLLPDGFKMGNEVGYSELASSGIYEKSVGFFREINGLKVYGHSDILVAYTNQGLSLVQSVYNDIQYYKPFALKSYDDGVKNILTDDAWINFDATKLKSQNKIIVNKCELVYYEYAPSADTSYIQPCYSFSGEIYDNSGISTDFSSIVPAIKDEFYK